MPIGQSAGLPPWKQTELILNLGYKAGTFKRFGEREGAYDLFSKFLVQDISTNSSGVMSVHCRLRQGGFRDDYNAG